MKKFLIGFGGVLLVMVGGLWVCVWFAGRDVPPPDEAEFAMARPDVAPEDNAFTYFLEATNRLADTTNDALLINFRMEKTPASDELRELVAKNAECLARVKRGTECAICLAPPVETIETPVPYVNPWLHMQRVLEARSRLARLEGRFADAADDLAVGMRFGDLVQKDAPCLIAYLVGVAIFTSSAESAMELARDPAAPPETLARLAAELDKIGSFDDGLVRALKTEHRMSCNVVDGLYNQLPNVASAGWADLQDGKRLLARVQKFKYCFKPNQTKRDLAADHRRWIANVPRVYAKMDRDDSGAEGMGWRSLLLPNGFGKYLFMIMTPSWKALLELKCGAECVLGGAKLAVGCNRFARDKGRWPEALEELAPEYLGAVPPDPYDGAPFRYSAEKGIAWGVGKNLTDEGGSMLVSGVEDASAGSRNRRRAEDFVFELKPTEEAE